MAQSFACLCGKPTCRGTISGAKDMTRDQLAGLWMNGHILDLLDEQDASLSRYGEGGSLNGHADRTVLATAGEDEVLAEGLARRGPTSRELSGEMGGDTLVAV